MRAQPIERPAPVPTLPEAPEPAEPGLYAPEEALHDVLSGAWQYLGTSAWPGVERSHACAFRNERVVFVNVYCTVTERQAFRLDVHSPERGRVRIYAEAGGPISTRQRADYFIFTAESEPAPPPGAAVSPVALGMSLQELRRYDRERYDAFLPGCYGGVRHGQRVGGCLGELAPRASEWAAQNSDFLEHANADWYRVVRDMRALALRHGTDPD